MLLPVALVKGMGNVLLLLKEKYYLQHKKLVERINSEEAPQR